MAKEGMKNRSKNLMLVLLGVGIAAWAAGFFDNLLTNFLNGIGYSARRVKFKFKNITTVRLTTVLGITNKNDLSVTVNSFRGNLRFGQGGPILAPVESIKPFTLDRKSVV